MSEKHSAAIHFLQKKLLGWYGQHGRKFFWRNKSLNNYQKIIAEILLQRTRADTVAKFYGQFIKTYPNWKAISVAETKEIEAYLKPIGLYRQRSVRLKNLAMEMVQRKGRLPQRREELESIPFIGQYIANSIELVIYNKPSPLIDVNMTRVFERFFGPRQMADIRYDPYLQRLAYAVVDHQNPKIINWAILDFAALVCKAQNPLCSDCPLNRRCTFYLYQKR